MKTLLLSIIVLFSLSLSGQPLPKHLLKAKELSDKGKINAKSQKDNLHARSAPFQLDSFNIWLWEGNEWVLFIRNVYTYNAQGLAESITQILVQGGSEMNIGLDSIFYDSEGRVILTQRYQWNGSSWDIFSREVTTYGQDSQEFVVQIWNGVNWANQFKINSEYDANGVLLSEVSSSWGGSDWDLSTRRIYSYNNDGNVDTIFIQNYDQNIWVDDQRITYTFDSQDRLLADLHESFASGQWENVFRTDYSYNNGVQTSISQEWVLNQWETVYRTDVLLDEDRVIYLTASSWDGLDWLPSDSIHYYYSDLSAVNHPVSGDQLVSVYPNPVKDILFLETESITGNISSVEIITATGERISTHKRFPDSKQTMNVSNLSPGMYYAVITGLQQVVTVKFLKL